MERFSIKELYKKMKIKEISGPLGYMLLLSMLYNIVYLGSSFISSVGLNYLIQIVLGLISSIGFYWICLQCWQKKMQKQAVVGVLFLETIYLGIVTGIFPALNSLFPARNLVVQLIGALVAIGMIPIQLVYFYALSNEIYHPKELIQYVKNVFKRHNKTIINWFCIAMITVFFVDTILGGIFSLASSIDTTSVASSVLLYGNPMLDWMMTLFMGLIFGVPFMNLIGYVFIFFFIGLWYGVMDLNYVLFIQRKCLDDGTSKNTTNKKKNRTSK